MKNITVIKHSNGRIAYEIPKIKNILQGTSVGYGELGNRINIKSFKNDRMNGLSIEFVY